jgi:hypothetical protein
MRWSGLLVAVAVLTVGCAGEAGGRSDEATGSESAVPSPSGSRSGSPTDPGAAAVVQAAVQHLSARLGIPESAVTVVSVAAVTWPDTSLGCPQPGMRYTQVPVDGARIVLSADGREYAYHSGGSRPPFLCPNR